VAASAAIPAAASNVVNLLRFLIPISLLASRPHRYEFLKRNDPPTGSCRALTFLNGAHPRRPVSDF
jgi:hypothetical protein